MLLLVWLAPPCLPVWASAARVQIKYRMWGAPCGSSAGYASTAKTMFLGAGYSLRPFFHGIGPTLWRDCLWAATFNGLRHRGLAWARGSFEVCSRTRAVFCSSAGVRPYTTALYAVALVSPVV